MHLCAVLAYKFMYHWCNIGGLFVNALGRWPMQTTLFYLHLPGLPYSISCQLSNNTSPILIWCAVPKSLCVWYLNLVTEQRLWMCHSRSLHSMAAH